MGSDTLKKPTRPPVPMATSGARKARSFVARVLGALESRKFAPNVPEDWYGPSPIAPAGEIPFASGIGFVSSPFSSYFDKAWGVLPQADQARYRIIYRTVPIAHAAVDKLVESATAKGFGLDVSEDNPAHDRILEIVKEWITAHPELGVVLQTAAKDLLVHGTAYVEPCFPETGFDMAKLRPGGEVEFNGEARKDRTQDKEARFEKLLPDARELEQAGVFTRFARYHPAFIQGIGPALGDQGRVPVSLYEQPFAWSANEEQSVVVLSRGKRAPREEELGAAEEAGEEAPEGSASPVVWLKNLDFLTMRVRRDAWGNVFGAIQYLVVPPVAFDTSKIVIGVWNPTSTFYESAYGVSLFQSLIRTQEAIWQLENDLLVIGHALAKPPHLFKRGIIDPASGRVTSMPDDPSWTAFQTSMKARKAGSDLFVLANIAAEPINQQLTGSISALIAYLQYHNQQRVIALKVPPQLLGVPEGSTRTTAEVNQGDYVLTVQSLQASLGRMMSDIFRCILEPFAAELGDGFEVPHVEWNPVMEADESEELRKLLEAYKARLITLAEARHLIVERGIFEIPDEDEEGALEAIAELEGKAQEDAEMRAFGGFGNGQGAPRGKRPQEREEPEEESPREQEEEAVPKARRR